MCEDDDVKRVPDKDTFQYMHDLDIKTTIPCKICLGRNKCGGRCIEYNIWWHRMNRYGS